MKIWPLVPLLMLAVPPSVYAAPPAAPAPPAFCVAASRARESVQNDLKQKLPWTLAYARLAEEFSAHLHVAWVFYPQTAYSVVYEAYSHPQVTPQQAYETTLRACEKKYAALGHSGAPRAE
ncbi:MAG: hypothetical protein ACRETQ_08470 [Gammaproteobacteria bacterium]